MKAGDLVRFTQTKITGGYLRQDAIRIVIRRSCEEVGSPARPIIWIVNFPRMGGLDGYVESWLEVINETG